MQIIILKGDGGSNIVMKILQNSGRNKKIIIPPADVPTILSLLTGIFYANEVKAKVSFFDNKPSSKDP